MAYNKNLYSSDTDALDAGIIYDQNEQMMQDEINAAIKNGDLIVGQADNLASKMNQFSTGEFIERTTGGDASLSDGEGHLVLIRGNMVHEGYIAQSVDMTVTPIPRDPSAGEFTALIDNGAFIAEASSTSGTMVFTYGSSGWDIEPSNYGITVIGMPLPGDEISVVYQKEVRGTITQSNPQTFVSTGWNLYDHSKGYARALYYNDNPRFGIAGTYTTIQYSSTLDGAKSSLTPDANGIFGIPQDANGGYIWVNGGNDTDTAVWMTWTDWTTEANGGNWEAYSESEIDLSEVMASYFPNGLMAVGAYRDEIDLSLGRATNNVGRVVFSAENLDDIIELGVEYDYDGSYIYYGLSSPVVNTISIDNTVDAYDHGIEYFTDTEVSIYAQTLYGINLKNRLERDVVTISQQTLSASEQSQIATNLNVVKKTGDTMTGQLAMVYDAPSLMLRNTAADTSLATDTAQRQWTYGHRDKNNNYISYWQSQFRTDGEARTNFLVRRIVDNADVDNVLRLSVDANGTRSVTVTDSGIWRDALNAVNKSGDTMTGNLIIERAEPGVYAKYSNRSSASVTTSANSVGFRCVDKDSNIVALYTDRYYKDGTTEFTGAYMAGAKVVNGTNILNQLQLRVHSDGTRSIYVTEAAPWRTALNVVNKAGDVMTGSLTVSVNANPNVTLKNPDIDYTTSPSASEYGSVYFRDKNDKVIGAMQVEYNTSGRVSNSLSSTRSVSGSDVSNTLSLRVDASGNRIVAFTEAAPWRSALGLGTSGALPITIAQGGTGQTEISYITTVSSILTKGSNITISSAYYVQWGKVAELFISWSTSSTITVQPDGNAANVTIGTLVSGKRPKITVAGTSYGDGGGPAFYLIGTDGIIQLGGCGGTGSTRTIAANTSFQAHFTYILP